MTAEAVNYLKEFRVRDTAKLFEDCIPVIKEKLDQNNHKIDWRHMTFEQIAEKIQEEHWEVREELGASKKDLEAVMYEFADLAATAMFGLQKSKKMLREQVEEAHYRR